MEAGSIIRAIDHVGDAEMLKDGNQSISNNSWTTVTFQVSTYDDYAMWDDAENRFVIPENMGGLYELTATVTFASNTSGRREVRFMTPMGPRGNDRRDPANTAVFPVTTIAKVRLVPGDAVSVEAYQNSGSTNNLQSHSGSTVTMFSIDRRRP